MKVLFTGGGSAGHVTPNVALIERLLEQGHQVVYLGSATGIEKDIVSKLNVPYRAVATGKLRRYFSWQNFIDPFKILFGVLQALFMVAMERPQVVFSKGGFVSVPVVFAALVNRVPVISHESDVTPGLATKLNLPFSRWLCVNFEESRQHLPDEKVKVTGTPMRQALVQGDASRAYSFLGVQQDKPIILVFGGSLGARTINQAVRAALPQLSEKYVIAHICGAGNLDADLDSASGYFQFEYLYEEFGDLLAAASMVVSRAGANSIYELLVAGKPHLLIPLGLQASRGDQIVNAETFTAAGYSHMLLEQDLTTEALVKAVAELTADRDAQVERLSAFPRHDTVKEITDLILEAGGHE